MGVPTYRGSDGRSYYTVAAAGSRLALTETQVRGLMKRGDLPATSTTVLVERLPAVRGRRPTKMIASDDVEARRRAVLEQLGAVEPTVTVVPDPDARRRAEELEEANADLRGQVASLKEMLRLSLVAEEAHLDQLRQVLTPTTPPFEHS